MAPRPTPSITKSKSRRRDAIAVRNSPGNGRQPLKNVVKIELQFTGSVLSLFPPENATGNYVKVVQRIPVRIDFTDLKNEDPNHALRPGLSVEPKVRVK